MKLVFDDGTEVAIESVKTIDPENAAVVVIYLPEGYEMRHEMHQRISETFGMPVVVLPAGSRVEAFAKAGAAQECTEG